MRIWFLCALMVSVSAAAGLEWKQKEVTLQVHPTQISAEAAFRFSNTGNAPVSIADISINCGCLSTKPTRPSYAPGEEGTLTVMVNLQGRTGPFRKVVKVKGSDGEEHVLAVVAEIPRAYSIAPIMMKWVKGNAAETKTARLTNPNREPIRIHSVTSSHKSLPAELKTIREGFEYEVIVTRLPEAINARSVVRIQTEPPPGQKKSKTLKFYVHAL